MRSFRTIAQTGSFSLAADQLRLTQSALSHQIAQLERELKARLFVRARPNAYLTEAGDKLLASTDRIFAELRTLRESFGVLDEEQERVRVAATTLGFSYIYGDICQAFMAECTSGHLEFFATETPEAAVSKVLARAADVAFVPLSVKQPPLRSIVLGDAEHVFIVSADHAFAEAETVSFDEIKRYPFIRYHRGSGSRILSDAVFSRQAGGYPAIYSESNDTEYVKRLVGRGLGIALVPVFAVQDELRDHRLHAFRASNTKIMDQYGCITENGRTKRILKQFLGVCERLRAEGPRQVTLETLPLAHRACV